MKELNFGETIQVGDKVSVGNGLREVSKVDTEFCYVRINKHTIVRLPNVYSEPFKSPDEIDETVYFVFRG